MSNAENAVRVAQAALQAAIINARAEGYRVTWQVSGGEHSVVINGGPEPVKAAPVEKPEPIATFGGGRRFFPAAPAPVAAPEEDHQD